ncbi:short-chain dehydrogenase [Roseibacillus persicicus]|uniref:Short-chain dehydrogenase n=2 Tax=Roseibacillus persicicus TaxID=454148 RepID=A0A918WPC5_9BACT|nr:short-chain dehydrogenase [Roseibacillus persicicus]
MSVVLLIGATSAIGASLVRALATQGNELYLVGRNAERLAGVVEDAKLRGSKVIASMPVDLADLKNCEELKQWISAISEVEHAIILPGVLSDELGTLAQWSQDVMVNFTVPSFLARTISEKMSSQSEGGHLVLIGSVAGDRGRQSNGFYGSQKGALEIYAEALRHRTALKNCKVKVSFVKPGFVVSPMTAELKKNVLFSEPDQIAKKIVSLFSRGRSGVVYAPGWWRLIMLLIKLTPNFIFHRTRL